MKKKKWDMKFSKHETMGKAMATEEKGDNRELGWREGGLLAIL